MEFLVNIDVSNLETAPLFYGAAFGLEVGRRFAAIGVEMFGGPAPLYLLARRAGTAAAATTRHTRSDARHWTPVHLDFVVEDIDSAVQRATAAGAQLEGPVTTEAWGKLALMADPFGHGFCFVQFLGCGYDELVEGWQRSRSC